MFLTTILLLAALIVPATAQLSVFPPLPGQPLPKTITIKDKNGNVAATMTTSGDGRGYLRDSKGELIGTLVTNPDGTTTMFDPNGVRVISPAK